jgi:hypothetical protein
MNLAGYISVDKGRLWAGPGLPSFGSIAFDINAEGLYMFNGKEWVRVKQY